MASDDSFAKKVVRQTFAVSSAIVGRLFKFVMIFAIVWLSIQWVAGDQKSDLGGVFGWGGWFVDSWGRLRVWVALVPSFALAWFTPNFKLPEWSRNVALGTIAALVASLLLLTVSEELFAHQAIHRAAAAFDDSDDANPKPHSGSKFYPPAGHVLRPRAILLGLTVGPLLGLASLRRGRWRIGWSATAAALAVAICWEAGVAASAAMDRWVDWQLEFAQRRNDHSEK